MLLLAGLSASGTRTELAFSGSLASTFVEPGGSFMCDASVGSDQREGWGLLKKVEGV